MTSVCQCLQRNSKSAAVCPMLYLGIFLSNSSIETNGSEKILEMKKQIILKKKINTKPTRVKIRMQP